MTSPIEFAVAAPLTARGLTARLAERLRRWRQHRRWIGDMANAAALGSLDDTLNDVGLTRTELDTLIEAPEDAGTQFETLAEMARVDLHKLDPAVLREASWVCRRCEARAPCTGWLRTGVWRSGVDMRCPNAAIFHH
ncbi:MAG TPA: hypothetical protein VGS13_07340 [Stellaceae bacterium]|nr:hypothetical protein [Stellaceae bacterium]